MTQYLSNPGLICAGANSAAELFGALCKKRSSLQKLSVCGKNFIFGRVDTALPKIKDRAYATRTNALALYACLGVHGQIEQAVQKFGLDLEILKPRNFAAASEFCFNDFERELLAAADESEKTLVFYKIYTIKEALIKARYLGFYALARVGLARGADGEVLALDERGRAWSHKSYILEGEILISLVFRENF